FLFRVLLKNEIAVRRILVRTNSALHQRSIDQIRKTVRDELARMCKNFGFDGSFAGRWVKGLAPPVDANLESPVSVARNTIIIVFTIDIHPNREIVESLGLRRWYAEIVRLLLGTGDHLSEHLRKKGAQPRPACIYI